MILGKKFNVDVDVHMKDKNEKIRNFEINTEDRIMDLIDKLMYKIKRYGIEYDVLVKNSQLLIDNVIYPEEDQMKIHPITENNSFLLLINLAAFASKDEVPSMLVFVDPNEFCPEKLVPNFTKVGYKIHPKMSYLARLTLNGMKNVKKFKIWNEHGQIEFIGPTDLVGVNLDDISISPKNIMCFDQENYKNEDEIPNVGRKLNKPCIITLFNIEPSKTHSLSKFIRRLEIRCEKTNSRFIDYNSKNKEWKFRVECLKEKKKN